MKELSRVYDINCDNEVFLKQVIDALKNNRDKFFLAFRTSPQRLTLYHKGREMVALIPKSKEKWMIKPRGISTSINPKYVKINSDYMKSLKNSGYTLKQQLMMKNKKYDKLIDITRKFLDEYYFEREEEKTIQNDIACRYQFWKNDLLCVDQEYNQCFENTSKKEESEIQGRYDLIMVKRVNDNLYIPVFVELKSNEAACKNCTSGIINHISDMQTFLDKYYKDESSAQTVIKKGIKFAVERKYKFGFIPEDISDKIDFSKPEFWLLFDMTKKYKKLTPTTKEQLNEILDLEVNYAKHVKETYKNGKNVSNYNQMVKQPIKINNEEIKKFDLCDRKDIVDIIKEDALKYAYYDDFIKIEK